MNPPGNKSKLLHIKAPEGTHWSLGVCQLICRWATQCASGQVGTAQGAADLLTTLPCALEAGLGLHKWVPLPSGSQVGLASGRCYPRAVSGEEDGDTYDYSHPYATKHWPLLPESPAPVASYNSSWSSPSPSP